MPEQTITIIRSTRGRIPSTGKRDTEFRVHSSQDFLLKPNRPKLLDTGMYLYFNPSERELMLESLVDGVRIFTESDADPIESFKIVILSTRSQFVATGQDLAKLSFLSRAVHRPVQNLVVQQLTKAEWAYRLERMEHRKAAQQLKSTRGARLKKGAARSVEPKPGVEASTLVPQPVVEEPQPDADGSLLYHGFRVGEHVRAKLERLGVTLDQCVDALRRPEITTPASYTPGGRLHRKNGYNFIFVLDGDEDTLVDVSPMPASSEGNKQPPPPRSTRPVAQPRMKGTGHGKTHPVDLKDLNQRLTKAGFEQVKGRDNHLIYIHPKLPGQNLVVPATTSDHRVFKNLVSEVRRIFGIDISKKS